jgi:hypothetical protein
MVSAVGEKIPVLVSPVNVSAGAPADPKPVASCVALAEPSVGVTNVGELLNTTDPVPVDVEVPVPPPAGCNTPDEFTLVAREARLSACDIFIPLFCYFFFNYRYCLPFAGVALRNVYIAHL